MIYSDTYIGEFAKAHQSAKAHHPTIGENKGNQDKIPRLLNEETQKNNADKLSWLKSTKYRRYGNFSIFACFEVIFREREISSKTPNSLGKTLV